MSGPGCNVCHHAETVTVGPLMAPGEPCLACHGPGGMATAKFSAAGTVRPNVAVAVAGHTTTTNAAGNFYFSATTTPISFATRQPASVAGSAMENGAPSGECNACHGNGRNQDGDSPRDVRGRSAGEPRSHTPSYSCAPLRGLTSLRRLLYSPRGSGRSLAPWREEHHA